MQWQKAILIATSSASRHMGIRAPSGVTQYAGLFNWVLRKGKPPLIGTTS